MQFDRFIGKMSKEGPLAEEDISITALSTQEEEKLLDGEYLKVMVPETREVHERLRPITPPPEQFLAPETNVKRREKPYPPQVRNGPQI